jgi:hypothetical protein
MITREEARKLWIEDLKSNSHPQGKYRLHGERGYCCLGVACDLFAEELHLTRYFVGTREYFNSEQFHLPQPVIDLLGLVDCEGKSKSGKKPYLSNLNDNKDYTFAQIATELETGDYWID